MTLTVREILDLARATGLIVVDPASPLDDHDMESEYTIIEQPVIKDDDGTERRYHHGAYLTEYPEEGMFGLGPEIPTP